MYKYLLNNGVAYSYCLKKKNRNKIEKHILSKGKEFNDKFAKTIRLLNSLGEKYRIPFLVFKTYKYLPEAMDGDIDLIVHRKDFYNFLKMLTMEGFACIENEPLKAFCIKEGYTTIEPRVHASFHGIKILDEKELWTGQEGVKFAGVSFNKTAKEIDLCYLLLNTLYGPNYLKLYLYRIIEKTGFTSLYKLPLPSTAATDLKFLENHFFTKKMDSRSFPLFLGNFAYFDWWVKRILPSKLTWFEKCKHLAFFAYMKARYKLTGRLVFAHDWGVNI